MLKIIRELENKELTNEDILRISKNNCKVVMYDDLKRIGRLEELFASHTNIALLYETNKNVGHWVGLIYRPENHILEIFDSYGFGRMDAELKYAHYDTQAYLTNLVTNAQANTNLRVKVSNVKLQERMQDVNTCGRWVAIRFLNSNLTNTQFESMFIGTNLTKPDDIVSALTYLA